MVKRALQQNLESTVRVALTRDKLAPDDVREALYGAIAIVEAHVQVPLMDVVLAREVVPTRGNGG